MSQVPLSSRATISTDIAVFQTSCFIASEKERGSSAAVMAAKKTQYAAKNGEKKDYQQ